MSPNKLSKASIVFLTPSVFGSANNGPAIYAQYLWDAFSQSDEFDFHLVTPESTVKHPNIHASGVNRSSPKQYRQLQTRGLEVADALSVSGRFPIVHGNTTHTMWLFKSYRGPVIAQVNDYDASDIFDHPLTTLKAYGPRRVLSLAWRHLNERKACQFLDTVVCNSHYTRGRVIKKYRVAKEKTCVIYKAVDADSFQRAIENYPAGADGNRLQILFVGCNWHRKGLDVLIKAIHRVQQNHGQRFSLIVAGKQSQVADNAIAALPKELGIEDRVTFLGGVERETLPKLFASSDLFILPSRQEALGVAILEALACGVPVIGSDAGGIPEILKGSDICDVVAAGDVQALSDSIHATMNKVRRDSFSAEAECKLIAAKFSKDIMIESLKNLYRSLACQ